MGLELADRPRRLLSTSRARATARESAAQRHARGRSPSAALLRRPRPPRPPDGSREPRAAARGGRQPRRAVGFAGIPRQRTVLLALSPRRPSVGLLAPTTPCCLFGRAASDETSGATCVASSNDPEERGKLVEQRALRAATTQRSEGTQGAGCARSHRALQPRARPLFPHARWVPLSLSQFPMALSRSSALLLVGDPDRSAVSGRAGIPVFSWLSAKKNRARAIKRPPGFCLQNAKSLKMALNRRAGVCAKGSEKTR